MLGAVVVSTPQDIALLDAVRAVSMFQRVDVPVVEPCLGVYGTDAGDGRSVT